MLGTRLGSWVDGRRFLLAGTWGLAAVAATVIFLGSPQLGGIPGVSEVVEYRVASEETVRVLDIPVSAGQPVQAGDVLMRLDPSPLIKELTVLQGELAQRQAELRVQHLTDERGFQAEMDRMESALSQLRWSMEQEKADMEAANARIQYWSGLVEKGLAPAQMIADLKVNAAASEQRLRALNRERAELEGRIKTNRRRMDAFRSAAPVPSAVESEKANTIPGALADVEALMNQVRARLEKLTLRAPADGIIHKVLAQPGDVTTPGAPLVLLREASAKRVLIYPSASQLELLTPNTRVWVVPRDGSGRKVAGYVHGVESGAVRFPDQLSMSTPSARPWGHELVVALDDETNTVAPGQVVYTVINTDDAHTRGGEALAAPAPADAKNGMTMIPNSEPRVMVVPETLRELTRFESSGLVWIPELDRYLVVSDDTGMQGADNENAPWLFLMDRHGQLDPRPMEVRGVKELRDLESITRTPDGSIWVLSSQSVSKKGKRPEARTMLTRMRLQGAALVAEGQASLTNALASWSQADLDGLGLKERDTRLSEKKWNLVVEIEGMTAFEQGLLLGLKQPLDEDSRAILWYLRDPARFLETGKVEGLLTRFGAVSLQAGTGTDATAASISDLALLPDLGLAILAVGRPGPDDSEEIKRHGKHGSVWYVPPPLQGGILNAKRVHDYPGWRPEGVAVTPDERGLMIVFDTGNNPPRFSNLPLPR